jgi:hypothetical protein
VAPFFDGSGGSDAYIVVKKLARSVVCYGGLPPPYSGSKGFSFRGEFGVALDRGEADAEEASGLRLGCTAPLYGA